MRTKRFQNKRHGKKGKGQLKKRVTKLWRLAQADVHQMVNQTGINLDMTTLPNREAACFEILPAIAQGDTIQQRAGDTIAGLKIKWNYNLVSASYQYAINIETVRVTLVRSKLPKGAKPLVGDIYALSASAYQQNFSDFNITNVPSAYEVLYDRLHVLDNKGSVNAALYATAPNIVAGKTFKYTHPIKYSGTTGVLAEYRANQLFVIVSAPSSIAASAAQGLVFNTTCSLTFNP